MASWNPWHGCHRISDGCLHCYVYRMDRRYDRDSSIVNRTAQFDLPVRKARNGTWKIPSGEEVFTCFTSDFLVEDADPWRPQAWDMIRQRSDLSFLFITKRIRRFRVGLPADWGIGYPHVTVGCTVENQRRADERLPVFLDMPIRRREIICEPLLGPVDLSPYLSEAVHGVVAGGESGPEARLCRYEWILALRDQCRAANVAFHFKQTGARFEKDGTTYNVPRQHQHRQARKAGIDLPAGAGGPAS